MHKDDHFWLNACYVTFALITGYVFWLIVNTVGIQTGWLERYDSWWVPMNHGVAALLGVGATLVLRSNSERDDYFLQSIGELKKVKWPSGEDTKRMTIIVCAVVAVFSGILAVFDMAWSFVLQKIIS